VHTAGSSGNACGGEKLGIAFESCAKHMRSWLVSVREARGGGLTWSAIQAGGEALALALDEGRGWDIDDALICRPEGWKDDGVKNGALGARRQRRNCGENATKQNKGRQNSHRPAVAILLTKRL
jgi:hypothetical protein